MKEVRIVYQGGTAETEEKKSRFIAAAVAVHTEEEALAFLASLKKKYWDASHNCWAYVMGENGQLMRCSDDGEPQGTAGRPILDVLTGAGICGAMIVVTRYFGGTLLGTGGLVRAYGKAASEALKNSRVMTKKEGVLLRIRTDYTDVGRLQYLFGQKDIPVYNSEYTDSVMMEVLIEAQELDSLKRDLTECTAGRVIFESEKKVSFAQDDTSRVILD